MGKRKKEKVNLNGSPLQAITIGEIKQSKYGWIGTILLFVLFIGIVFYLPEIFEWYENFTKTPVAPSNAVNLTNRVPENNTTTGNEVYDDVDAFKFGTDKKFTFDIIDVSEVQFDGTNITYKVVNNTEDILSLSSLNLFIELFDNKNHSLIEYPLKGTVGPKETTTLTQEVAKEIVEKVVSYNVDNVEPNLSPDEDDNATGEPDLNNTIEDDEEDIVL